MTLLSRITMPGQVWSVAAAGPGEFLIGSQGYGAFTTGRYGRDVGETAWWASHGAMLVNGQGTICGPELACGPGVPRAGV